MRKINIYIIVGILLLLICGFGNDNNDEIIIESEPDVVCSISSNRDYDLIVIANKEEIIDKESFAKELIQMCVDNSFNTIRFSTDFGYATGIKMKVYSSEEDWQNGQEAVMSLSYTQESLQRKYDIVNNPEMFGLEVE